MDKKQTIDYLSTFTDADKCLECFKEQKTFFRVNTLKISNVEFFKTSKLTYEQTSVTNAFSLEEKIEIGKTWEYYLGYLHSQSLPSILVSLVLNPKNTDQAENGKYDRKQYVLDLCASPGSKFSHLAALMGNTGVLVGNDVKEEKISALYSTINRLNVLNCIVTRGDASRFWIGKKFDKILLDAPCSALGSAYGAMSRYTLDVSKNLAIIQKKMINNAFSLLREGGELVYSTCTYAKEENEEIVKFLLEKEDEAELIDIGGSASENSFENAPHEKGLSDYGDEFKKCWRIYPQNLNSEGFFMAKIRKQE